MLGAPPPGDRRPQPAGRAPDGQRGRHGPGHLQRRDLQPRRAARATSRPRGHAFRSDHCDTEVLVHLWEEHGQDMVDHLIGMFAFAIWDANREQLFVARDRARHQAALLGRRRPPLRLRLGDQGAAATLLPRREIDDEALAHYLTFVAVPPPRTLFAGVYKLAPGHDDARSTTRRPAAAAPLLGPARAPRAVRRRGRGLGGGDPLPPRALDRPPHDERRARRRLPVGRRGLVDQRRADEPARRPPDQHVLDRLPRPGAVQRVRLGAPGRRAATAPTTTR